MSKTTAQQGASNMNQVDSKILDAVSTFKNEAGVTALRVYRHDGNGVGMKMVIGGKSVIVEMKHYGDGALRCRMFEKGTAGKINVTESGITDAGISRKLKALEYFVKRARLQIAIWDI
jgi:hypothetical protein|tara:strand:+ start:309 stop:662 length:354 start_codon:yes stop_codon:yes gene_type:complete